MPAAEGHRSAGHSASEPGDIAMAEFIEELTLLTDRFSAAADEFHRSHGLHATDSAALHQLSRGRMAMGELASRLGLTPAAATSVVDRLESAGLAERRADEQDRRRTIVAAVSLADPAAEEFHRRVFDALSEVPAKELSRLAAIVRSLRSAIDAGGAE